MVDLPQAVAPAPDELTQPFWDSATEGVLVVQQCQRCAYYSHPPRVMCTRCHSTEQEWVPVSGKGRVYSWAVMRVQAIAGFEEKVPYTTVLVELVEQPKLLLLGFMAGEGSDLEVGDGCEVCFEELPGTDFVLPNFRLLDVQ